MTTEKSTTVTPNRDVRIDWPNYTRHRMFKQGVAVSVKGFELAELLRLGAVELPVKKAPKTRKKK